MIRIYAVFLLISVFLLQFTIAQQCRTGGDCQSSCCSQFGYCGNSAEYCAPIQRKCNGDCWPTDSGPSNYLIFDLASSTPCGNGVVGVCPDGRCCSKFGYCGSSFAYCAPITGCISNCWHGNALPNYLTAVSAPSFAPATPPATSVSALIENPWSDPRGLYSTCYQKGLWALTFDDGPDVYTLSLLDTLKQYNVKATFFVVGQNVDKHPEFVKQAYNDGHMIASHSHTHTDLVSLPDDQIIEEMNKSAASIQKAIGVKPKYMRPPYGSFNERVLNILTTVLGYRVIIWNHDTLDWQTLNTQSNIESIRTQISAYGSLTSQKAFISLMHDIHPTSVASVPDILKLILGTSFKLVKMDECLGDTSSIYSV